MAAIRRRLRAEGGFSLVEVLMAWSVLLFAVVGTLKVFTGSQRGVAKAEQRAALVVVAQKELERLRGIPYAQLGLSSTPAASAEASRTGPSATEALVEGGVVDPGPTPFSHERVSGRIYRYLTWRPQACPLLSTKVATAIDAQAAVASGSASAALGDLCPGTEHTKRVVVAVVADDPYAGGAASAPVRAHTVVSDPRSGVLPNPAALAIDRSQDLAQETQTAQDALYAQASPQALYLYDTPCSEGARQPQTAGHETHDTGRKDHHCGSESGLRPDLMGLVAPPAEPVRDYSSDLVRSPVDGLALKRDSVGGSCADAYNYEPSDAAARKWSVHRWSTAPLGGAATTLAHGGRATLNLWTHTVGGATGSGRLCVIVRRPATGETLGYADFRLGQWPAESTPLAISFDLAGRTLSAGERLTLTVRNHPDSAHDIELLYDRADVPASLELTMAAGEEMQW